MLIVTGELDGPAGTVWAALARY